MTVLGLLCVQCGDPGSEVRLAAIGKGVLVYSGESLNMDGQASECYFEKGRPWSIAALLVRRAWNFLLKWSTLAAWLVHSSCVVIKAGNLDVTSTLNACGDMVLPVVLTVLFHTGERGRI